MTLRQKQSLFMLNLGKLILFAYENGYELTGGELLRTQSQQYLYVEGFKLMKLGSVLKLFKTKILSKTMFSKHLSKLAIDLNVFKNGVLLKKKEDFKLLAEYWKSLDERNDCGYFWGWDYSHFQTS